jgi:segregation and condensation protein B
MNKEKLKSVVEAMIFASDTPLTIHQMVSVLENFEKPDIEEVIGQITQELEGRAFTLKRVSGGYQFATRPEYSRWIKKMYQGKERNRLTRAALETLAIIAFKQPISRVEVSAIRGVNSDAVIKGLLERKLVTITGRGEGQGRALLFNTTPEFLQYFSLNDISDLPKPKEIEELLAAGEAAKIMSELEEAGIEKEEAGIGDEEETPALSEEEFLASREPDNEIDITVPPVEPATTEAEPVETVSEATVDEILAAQPVLSPEQLEAEMPSDEAFLAGEPFEQNSAEQTEPLAEELNDAMTSSDEDSVQEEDKEETHDSH